MMYQLKRKEKLDEHVPKSKRHRKQRKQTTQNDEQLAVKLALEGEFLGDFSAEQIKATCQAHDFDYLVCQGVLAQSLQAKQQLRQKYPQKDGQLQQIIDQLGVDLDLQQQILSQCKQQIGQDENMVTLFEKDLNFRQYEDYDIVDELAKEEVFQDVQSYIALQQLYQVNPRVEQQIETCPSEFPSLDPTGPQENVFQAIQQKKSAQEKARPAQYFQPSSRPGPSENGWDKNQKLYQIYEDSQESSGDIRHLVESFPQLDLKVIKLYYLYLESDLQHTLRCLEYNHKKHSRKARPKKDEPGPEQTARAVPVWRDLLAQLEHSLQGNTALLHLSTQSLSQQMMFYNQVYSVLKKNQLNSNASSNYQQAQKLKHSANQQYSLRTQYQSAMILKAFYGVRDSALVDSIDLHGFYQEDALRLLELSGKAFGSTSLFHQQPHGLLSLITGKGNRSHNHRSVLFPVVSAFLDSHRYKHKTHFEKGSISVFIQL